MTKLKATYLERVDKYIAKNTIMSRSNIQSLIKEHAIKVNDIYVRKSNFKVKKNDIIIISKIFKKEVDIVPEDIPIEVIYEDDDLIVVNKPTGMVVHPAPGHHNNTLVNALLFRFKGQLSDINGKARPGIVHRIDKDTSGLLVIAKHNRSHIFLSKQLKNHKISRKYKALVSGRVANIITHIDLPIGRDSKNKQKMSVIRENSKEAKTHVFIEKLMTNHTLVRCELETGRTHQIRVHLSYIGHPIIGDALYGKKIDNFGQRLHAYELIFKHPNGKIMTFISPVPEKIKG